MKPLPLELLGLSHAFVGKTVFSRIDLALAPTEAVVLRGSNGTGKTTLLRIAATLLSPSAGKAKILGHDVKGNLRRVRPLIGALMGNDFLIGELTIQENLEFYGRMYHLPVLADTIETWLARVELDKRRHVRVDTLSKGQRQRIGLVRSLLHKPALILWDEPFDGLDSASRDLFRKIALDAKKEAAILVVSHQESDVAGWVDRECQLEGGQLRS